jgi:GGDEF domain-containing protein
VEDVMQKMDDLTGLPTIGWVRDHWQEFADALPETNALLYFDVDSLYCVKDLFGMEESNNKLVFTADTIRENVPQEYPVVRFAGDEFLALVDDSKFTENDLKKLIIFLDDPGYKINVNYSNINHFSVSGCMLKSGEIDSFKKLGSLTDRAIEEIRLKKSPNILGRYEFQSVMVVKDAT